MDSASYLLPIKRCIILLKMDIFLADHQAMSQQPTPRTLNRLEICSKLSLAQVSPISIDPRRHHLPLKPDPLYHHPALWSSFSRPPFPACLCPPPPPIFHPTQSNLPRPPPVFLPTLNLGGQPAPPAPPITLKTSLLTAANPVASRYPLYVFLPRGIFHCGLHKLCQPASQRRMRK